MAIVATFIAGGMARPEAIGSVFTGEVEVTFTGATDYVTGGVLLNTASLYGFNFVDAIVPFAIGPSLAAGIAAWSFDKANGKVKFYTSGFAEVANAGNISTIKLYMRVKLH